MGSTGTLKKLTVRDTEMHYLDEGRGEPVVFVHGSLGDYRSWSLQLAAFREKFRVIAYSRRYHFPNEWKGDGRDYSASLHAEDLASFLDALNLEQVHVVSSSYGSYCGLVFAHSFSSRIRSLVVAEPPILNWLESLPGGRELIRPFLENAFIPCREAFLRGENEEAVSLFIDGVLGRRGAFNGLHPPIRAALMNNALEMKAECLSDRLFPKFGCDEAAAIQAPILLLSGEKSPPFFHRITAELLRCLSNSHEIVISGASHNLHSARPKQYNAAVLGFLAKVEAGEGAE